MTPSTRSFTRPDIAAHRRPPASWTLWMLVLFVVAGVAGEWVLHQLVYLVEYGNRFDAVMAATPHRLYMAPAGMAVAFLALLCFGGALGLLAIWGLARRRLLGLLPRRVRGSIRIRALRIRALCIPWNRVARWALFLAVAQAALFTAQENFETLAETGDWAGLGVLIPTQHPTVLPANLAIAVCLSSVLWLLLSALRQSRGMLGVIRALLSVYLHRNPGLSLPDTYRPALADLRVAGNPRLRAPPTRSEVPSA